MSNSPTLIATGTNKAALATEYPGYQILYTGDTENGQPMYGAYAIPQGSQFQPGEGVWHEEYNPGIALPVAGQHGPSPVTTPPWTQPPGQGGPTVAPTGPSPTDFLPAPASYGPHAISIKGGGTYVFQTAGEEAAFTQAYLSGQPFNVYYVQGANGIPYTFLDKGNAQSFAKGQSQGQEGQAQGQPGSLPFYPGASLEYPGAYYQPPRAPSYSIQVGGKTFVGSSGSDVIGQAADWLNSNYVVLNSKGAIVGVFASATETEPYYGAGSGYQVFAPGQLGAGLGSNMTGPFTPGTGSNSYAAAVAANPALTFNPKGTAVAPIGTNYLPQLGGVGDFLTGMYRTATEYIP